MKQIYVICCLLFISLMAQAQQPQMEWAKQIGDEDGSDIGYSITTDNDGNVYTTGVFMDTIQIGLNNFVAQNSDVFVTKQDSAGNYLWAKQLGGSGQAGSYSIAVDQFGNVFFTGIFSDTITFPPGPIPQQFISLGYYDMFICKLNAAGILMWAKHIGDQGYSDWGQNLKLGENGAIYISGYFTDTVDFDPGIGYKPLIAHGPGDTDAFALRLDSAGNFVWASGMGGPGFDAGMGIAVKDDDVYVTGVFDQTADFDPGPATYSLTAPGFAGSANGYVCKLDANTGNFIWAVQLGDVQQDWCNNIETDPFGDILVTGEFTGTVDFDPGAAQYNLTSQAWDIFVWKLSPQGNLIWAKQLGGAFYDWGNAIAVDDSGSVYTTGFFQDTADFDPGPGVFNLIAGGYWEVYINKLTSNGDFAWAVAFNGSTVLDLSVNQGWSVAVDNQYNIYTTGQFETNCDVDPGPDTLIFSGGCTGCGLGGFYYEDAFIHKMSYSTSVGLTETAFNKTQIRVYPNPVKDNLTIILPKNYATVELSIFDITGRMISTTNFYDVSEINQPVNLTPGVYVLQVRTNEGEMRNFKVLKD